MTKLSAVVPVMLLCACASSSTPPPSSPAPVPSSSETGATEAQGDSTPAVDLRGEVATIDSALLDLSHRLEAARDSVKVELQQQLVALQNRDDELKARLAALGTRADAESNRTRDDIHRALLDLQSRMNQLTDRLQR
jgi:hypothetical protein